MKTFSFTFYKSFFISILFFISITTIFPQKRVVGYYPDFLSSSLPVNKIKWENLTHIIHAFAWPTSTGEIELYSGMLDTALNDAAHNAGRKILIAFGGWGQSSGFAPMAADSSLRRNFINNIVDFIMLNEYDGIDLDWEFPANINEGKNLTILIKELRERFNEIDSALLITMAVNPGSWYGQRHEYEKMTPYINWFSMMGYDFHGSWTNHAGHNAPLLSPSIGCFDGSDNDGIIYLNVSRKIPKEKLLLGVPFYGREFTAPGLYQTQTGVTDVRYSTVAPRLTNPAWEYHWDNVSKVSYLQDTAHTKVVTFDDTATIKNKCDYILNNQLSGIMIWALGHDVIGNSQPLLETIGKALGLVTSVEDPRELIAEKFYLFNNYPNPFNPSTKIKFSIIDQGFVSLKVYNVLGQQMAVLINKEMNPGIYEADFNTSDIYDEQGFSLSAGMYIYTLTTENYSQSKKMIFLK